MRGEPRRDRLLTIRPRPNDTESLIKYIMRVSGDNGYPTPRNVLNRAGISTPALNRGVDVSKLALVTGWRSELQKIAYHLSHNNRGMSAVRLLGHQLRSEDLSFRSDRLCTACLRELRFVQAHFDLAIMIACPIHKRMLIARCPDCRETLSFYRPDLLMCRCGGSLEGLVGDLPPENSTS
jgi:hypothetical protein